jgi:hypothetical protein
MMPVGSMRQMKGEREVTSEERKARLRVRKEKDQRKRIAKDAAKGVLYSESGKDGGMVKLEQDVKKLMHGDLAGVEVVGAGEAILEQKKKTVRPKHTYLK